MDLLETLARNHQGWCRMVSSFGCPDHLVEDIVQEMYLRMYKYVETPDKILFENNEINTYYIYVTLRNMYIDYNKVKQRIPMVYEVVDLDDPALVNYDVVEYELLMKDLVDDIWSEVDSWYWYDQKMFRVYMETQLSMRDISRETTISLRSIFNTIKNGKQRIKDKFEADYQAHKKVTQEG